LQFSVISRGLDTAPVRAGIDVLWWVLPPSTPCLLFEQTKQLFQRWLFYGIGTMFSMAVLAAMVSIALDMVVRVAATFWTTALVQEFILKESMSDGMTSQAMQQGGMGLILTALILTTPPMAAMFFQGTLGTFMAYSQIGDGASASPSADGRPPGMSAPPPAAPESSSGSNSHGQQSAMGKMFDGPEARVQRFPVSVVRQIRVMETRDSVDERKRLSKASVLVPDPTGLCARQFGVR